MDELVLHGPTITNARIDGLVGGSPQMLWPLLCDCVPAILTTMITTTSTTTYLPANNEAWATAKVQEWLYQAMMCLRPLLLVILLW